MTDAVELIQSIRTSLGWSETEAVKRLPADVKLQILKLLVPPEDRAEYWRWRNRMIEMLAPHFLNHA